jgi:thioredoxin reductase (NADPH)
MAVRGGADMKTDVIILGSGPAGYTAAIYTARAALSSVLVGGREPGGQLMITSEIENYPGFPEGIAGPKLMEEMRRQAERFGTKIVSGEATSVDFSKSPLIVNVGSDCYEAGAVIIATGASAQWLGLESEKKLMGKGVSGCATCDGFFFRGQEVVVVGGGDTAIEEAIFLTRFARKVTVVHRRDELRASKFLQKKAKSNPKIEFAWKKIVVDILDVNADKVTAVKMKDVDTGAISEKKCDGVFIAIGHTPNTAVFKGHLKLDEKGYIITKKSTCETSAAGVFAAGDVQDSTYRQAITAAGSGCMAAIDAERYLNR